MQSNFPCSMWQRNCASSGRDGQDPRGRTASELGCIMVLHIFGKYRQHQHDQAGEPFWEILSCTGYVQTLAKFWKTLRSCPHGFHSPSAIQNNSSDYLFDLLWGLQLSLPLADPCHPCCRSHPPCLALEVAPMTAAEALSPLTTPRAHLSLWPHAELRCDF